MIDDCWKRKDISGGVVSAWHYSLPSARIYYTAFGSYAPYLMGDDGIPRSILSCDAS